MLSLCILTLNLGNRDCQAIFFAKACDAYLLWRCLVMRRFAFAGRPTNILGVIDADERPVRVDTVRESADFAADDTTAEAMDFARFIG